MDGGFQRSPVGHEHNLACHASVPEQLLRVSCLGQRKSLRDERVLRKNSIWVIWAEYEHESHGMMVA